jgi:hypothetical protein
MVALLGMNGRKAAHRLRKSIGNLKITFYIKPEGGYFNLFKFFL